MKLVKQNRLDFLLQFINQAETLADIGTDHGYVPIKALQLKKVKFAYAADLNKRPLDQAKQNIKKANLTDKIELILSDGLVFFQTHQLKLDYVVIAGLGALTISRILENDYAMIRNYLLCSNTDPLPIRRELQSKKLLIEKEFFLLDQERKYWFLLVSRTKGHAITSEEDLYLGTDKTLLQDLNYQEYLGEQIQKYQKLLPVVRDVQQKEHYQFLINLMQEGKKDGSTKNN